MNVDLRNNKDFLAGLLLIAVGAGGFFMALDYPFGSALRMGPGYFPRVLAGVLMTFGVFVLIRGIFTGEKVKGRWGWKPLAFITVSLVAFGFIMDRVGLIPALVVMFIVSALGGHEFRWKEVAILTVVMSAFAVAVFVYGLGLPYQLFPGWY
jgi:Tripartite tricarboxylate transporter TctB family